MTIHNLPNAPYKKFFGRSESIEKIKETLIKGGTFIASIDGVGGIGKTALAYYFCKEVLVPSKEFDYIVWITSKKTVFDAFSKEILIKVIDNEFSGIETLIDTTLQVVGLEELVSNPLDDKRKFFEEEIVTNPIFFVLDNLENVEDDKFFDYITKKFNQFSANNRKLKVLTTSRKRKKIADFPIDVEGLALEDALRMLKYLAKQFNVKAILNTDDLHNVGALERVGNIPLGIEFIVGQMALGKSLGQVYRELQGYPSLEKVTDPEEKKKVLSEIIMFSFKDMYEALDKDHERVFKTVAALQKHKKKDEELPFELLMSITKLPKEKLDQILENLIDNKLVMLSKQDYSISQLAINFVSQIYEQFGQFEDEVIQAKQAIFSTDYKPKNKVDMLLETVNRHLEKNEYVEAEVFLSDLILHYKNDYRLYYELAKIQRVLKKFPKSVENFKEATILEPNNKKIWYDWIDMEDSSQRHGIALSLIDDALEKTNRDISILIQKLYIYKFKKDYDKLRKEVRKYTNIYISESRKDDYIKLLRTWKNIEYGLIKEEQESQYIEAAEELISEEPDKEKQLQILYELLRVAKKYSNEDRVGQINRKIRKVKDSIKSSMGTRIKILNKHWNDKEYEKAKREARSILKWFDDEDDVDSHSQDLPHYTSALRVLLQILATERDYEKIITVFEVNKRLGYIDQQCKNIYEKAKKEIIQLDKDELIKEICNSIQHSEINLRNLVMWSFQNNENTFVNYIILKNKKEWVEQWKMNRSRAMQSHNSIIYYSDLGQLRDIIDWCESAILTNVQTLYPKQKNNIESYFKKAKDYLKTYVHRERNEAFHSRLQSLGIKELKPISSDTERLLDLTQEINDLLNI